MNALIWLDKLRLALWALLCNVVGSVDHVPALIAIVMIVWNRATRGDGVVTAGS